MYFRNYGVRKTWLDKYLKSPFSEDPLTSNIVSGVRHCGKLNNSTVTISIYPSEENSGSKSLAE